MLHRIGLEQRRQVQDGKPGSLADGLDAPVGIQEVGHSELSLVVLPPGRIGTDLRGIAQRDDTEADAAVGALRLHLHQQAFGHLPRLLPGVVDRGSIDVVRKPGLVEGRGRLRRIRRRLPVPSSAGPVGQLHQPDMRLNRVEEPAPPALAIAECGGIEERRVEDQIVPSHREVGPRIQRMREGLRIVADVVAREDRKDDLVGLESQDVASERQQFLSRAIARHAEVQDFDRPATET